MLHDAGYAQFFQVEGDEKSPPPHKTTLVEKGGQCFGEKTVGVTRFYEAAKAGKRVDKLIEIWRDDRISVRDVCRIGGQFYLIQQTNQTTDEDGLQVTRLTLEETDGNVWEGVRDG